MHSNKVREQANLLYPKFKTDITQSNKHHKYWHDFAEKNLYGIEINEQISRAAKMNMIIHDDGHTNVITPMACWEKKTYSVWPTTKAFCHGRFDYIITNPPFGSDVHRNEKAYLGLYDFGKKKLDWLAPKK